MTTQDQYYKYNPEKRNIFIETFSPRTNYVKNFIIGFFLLFASPASSIVEVFLRRKFGERYITLSQSIGIFIIAPIIVFSMSGPMQVILFLFGGAQMPRGNNLTAAVIILELFFWAYLIMSIRHRLEIKKYGTAYDFKRFSLSDGLIHPLWYRLIGKEVFGIKISYYYVVTLLEPLIPVLIGILFILIPPFRLLGVLLFICGLSFGMRNFHRAQQGRNWVLDNIDKKICSEEQYNIFIGRKPKSETRGLYLPIELPDDENTRHALYNAVSDANTIQGDIWDNDELDEE